MNRAQIRTAIVVGILLGATAVLLVAAFNRDGEPSHDGKKLTAWLDEVSDLQDSSPDERERRAANAVRTMGTNALPSMMRMFRARDSDLKERLRSLLYRQKLLRIPLSPPATVQRVLACRGLRILGPEAAPALPALEENLDSQQPDPNVPAVLLSTGPTGWPLFLRAMTHQDPEIRIAAVGALRGATTRLEDAVPVLLRMMEDDPLQPLRIYAATTIAQTGEHEDIVIPLLLSGLGFRNDTAADSARAFANYPLKAAEHKAALIRVAEGPDTIASLGAIDALKRIDPTAAEAAEKARNDTK